VVMDAARFDARSEECFGETHQHSARNATFAKRAYEKTSSRRKEYTTVPFSKMRRRVSSPARRVARALAIVPRRCALRLRHL
jgi:hypothetical protein